MTIVTRFAPSPTGYIHIGNARTALSNWLFSKSQNGKFIFRLDDTDVERSKTEYADAIGRDLAWFGIVPDAYYRQSDRFAVYQARAEYLKEKGVLYPCFETADELERKRKLRLARKLPPVYTRDALKLSPDDIAELIAQGKKPHWRFLLPNFKSDPFKPERTEVHWEDLVRGYQTVDLASLSDPVLIREDGTWLYTMPSVVDDIDMGITHVIRGEDHVTNTGAQIALFRALDAEPPVFGHHNLLTTVSGEGLSKRTGALSIGSLATAGYEPEAVASLAILTGTSDSVEAQKDMASLSKLFNLSHVSKSAAKFDPAELDVLNRTLVHQLSFEDAEPRLTAMGIHGPIARSFWETVRVNIERVLQAKVWWDIVTTDKATDETLADDEKEFVRAAFDLLPQSEFGQQTWKSWTDAVKAQSGRSGKALFMPLRIALTGRSNGPELANLLPLIGRARTLARRP
ncbi:MAG: glutamate--tRNA ligase [Rhizobiaceae bacterium]